MEYGKRDKIKKILKYVAIIAGVLLVLILGLLFIQAHHNAATKGQPYSIKKFIIDFGASIRGKQISDPSIFDGGLFPIFGLNGDGNLPIDGNGTNGGTTINTDGSGNGTGGDGTSTDGNGDTDGQNGNGTIGDGTGNGTDGTQTPECSDRVDNDADGTVDMDDPDCTDPSDYFESTYNWDTGGDGFYNYDNGTYGPIDYGDFGFDPNYNFDTGFTDTTDPLQCVPKDYIFTDAEQLDMDKYLREFYRIAPNIRTQADVDAEVGAKESYGSLIANADRLLLQCKEHDRPLYPNRPQGARGILSGLLNYKDDPNLPDISNIHFESAEGMASYLAGFTTSKTFFPPSENSLPLLGPDDLAVIMKKRGVDLSRWPGVDNGQKLRDAGCMAQNSNGTITCGGSTYPAILEYVHYGVFQTAQGIATLPPGTKVRSVEYFFSNDPSVGSGGYADGVVENIAVFNKMPGIAGNPGNDFWNSAANAANYGINGMHPWGNDTTLGACYIEMIMKYYSFIQNGSTTNPVYSTPFPWPIAPDAKTFWNAVVDCTETYDAINVIRNNFEATFSIN